MPVRVISNARDRLELQRFALVPGDVGMMKLRGCSRAALSLPQHDLHRHVWHAAHLVTRIGQQHCSRRLRTDVSNKISQTHCRLDAGASQLVHTVLILGCLTFRVPRSWHQTGDQTESYDVLMAAKLPRARLAKGGLVNEPSNSRLVCAAACWQRESDQRLSLFELDISVVTAVFTCCVARRELWCTAPKALRQMG